MTVSALDLIPVFHLPTPAQPHPALDRLVGAPQPLPPQGRTTWTTLAAPEDQEAGPSTGDELMALYVHISL